MPSLDTKTPCHLNPMSNLVGQAEVAGGFSDGRGQGRFRLKWGPSTEQGRPAGKTADAHIWGTPPGLPTSGPGTSTPKPAVAGSRLPDVPTHIPRASEKGPLVAKAFADVMKLRVWRGEMTLNPPGAHCCPRVQSGRTEKEMTLLARSHMMRRVCTSPMGQARE